MTDARAQEAAAATRAVRDFVGVRMESLPEEDQRCRWSFCPVQRPPRHAVTDEGGKDPAKPTTPAARPGAPTCTTLRRADPAPRRLACTQARRPLGPRGFPTPTPTGRLSAG